MTDALARIAAALAVTRALPLLPAQEEELRYAATVGTIHYSTLIEGNTLGFPEAEQAARGVLAPRTKAQLELVNHVRTLDWLDGCHADRRIAYDAEFLLSMHGRLTQGLGRDGEMFAPRHEGAYRDGIALIPDELDQIVFEGFPPERIVGEMDAMFAYLADRRTRPVEYPGAILAGLAHHRITDVHPFADGNGRTARTFAIAILMREGLLPERIFSFERHYAERKVDYFAALRTVTRTLPNYTAWLEYFLAGLVEEYERVAARVEAINSATAIASTKQRLSSTEELILAALSVQPLTSERLAGEIGKARRVVTDELGKLVELGVVRRHRLGRDRIYQLARTGSRRGGAGRPTYWTDERIATGLRDEAARLGHFPSGAELGAANSALLRAVRRHGGLREWRRRLERG